jgi:Tol biopolymer transport system component
MAPRIAHLAALVGLVVVVLVSHASARPNEPAARNASASRVPTWASTGFIAYRCRDDLCLMRPDGNRKRRLLSVGPSPQWDPAFSPRARRLAFRGYYGLGDGQYALYVIGTNGCSIRRLTRSIAGHPSWSPDGRWIAFDTSGADEIWKVHPNGTDLTRITGGEFPAWSPDGTRIAYVRYESGRGEIWVVRADGSRARLLHKGGRASDEAPAWSHDGKRIAFLAYAGRRSWIEVMKANGTGARTLRGRGNPWNPVWLPGDTGIAFLAWGTNGERGLFVMRPDGSHVHRVAVLKAEQVTWASARLPRRRC